MVFTFITWHIYTCRERYNLNTPPFIHRHPFWLSVKVLSSSSFTVFIITLYLPRRYLIFFNFIYYQRKVVPFPSQEFVCSIKFFKIFIFCYQKINLDNTIMLVLMWMKFSIYYSVPKFG